MEKLNLHKIKETLMGGLVKNNPTFVLVLGMCPTIAMTQTLSNAFAMGLATAFVLVFSNLIISLLRNIIPNRIRIPCYIVIISTFVIIVEMVMQRFLPELYNTMRAFITLIVVNCIILARAESFASKSSPLYSVIDGLSMGIGFTLSICLIGLIREFIASGSVFGYAIEDFPTMSGEVSVTVGLIVLAVLMASFNQIILAVNKKKANKLKLQKQSIVGQDEVRNVNN